MRDIGRRHHGRLLRLRRRRGDRSIGAIGGGSHKGGRQGHHGSRGGRGGRGTTVRPTVSRRRMTAARGGGRGSCGKGRGSSRRCRSGHSLGWLLLLWLFVGGFVQGTIVIVLVIVLLWLVGQGPMTGASVGCLFGVKEGGLGIAFLDRRIGIGRSLPRWSVGSTRKGRTGLVKGFPGRIVRVGICSVVVSTWRDGFQNNQRGCSSLGRRLLPASPEGGSRGIGRIAIATTTTITATIATSRGPSTILGRRCLAARVGWFVAVANSGCGGTGTTTGIAAGHRHGPTARPTGPSGMLFAFPHHVIGTATAADTTSGGWCGSKGDTGFVIVGRR